MDLPVRRGLPRARGGQRSLDLLPREFELLEYMMRRMGQTITRAMLWHRRLDDVPAHRWLRGVVLRASRTLSAHASPMPGRHVPVRTLHWSLRARRR